MVIHNGKKLKLGLALGSGGAKGAALIGALTVFVSWGRYMRWDIRLTI